MEGKADTPRPVAGGVDTHKDLHVAAVVDDQDRVLGTRSFPTTRQGYRQMLAWMRGFGPMLRIGVESTGSYGARLLRSLQRAGVEVLEVTAPDRQDRRRRGKNDDLDAENAAHALGTGQTNLAIQIHGEDSPALPPSNKEGQRWTTFTPPAAGSSRRYRGRLSHRRSHLSVGAACSSRGRTRSSASHGA